MGLDRGSIRMSFNGSAEQLRQLQRFLEYMEKDDDFGLDKNLWDDYLDFSDPGMVKISIEFENMNRNALLGKLDNGYIHSYDMKLAPQLFAALFPETEFSYSLECWPHNGGSCECEAQYREHTLTCAELAEEDSINHLFWEEVCKEEGVDPEKESWLEFCHDVGLNPADGKPLEICAAEGITPSDDEYDPELEERLQQKADEERQEFWAGIGSEDPLQYVLKTFPQEQKTLEPEVNQEYVKSFFAGCDIDEEDMRILDEK